jgi:hypothetical protein
MFNKYRERGLSLIPLKSGQKYPTMLEWQKYSERLPTEEETETWDRLWDSGHRSVGLVLGAASGVMALDLDHPDDNELSDLAPYTLVMKRGQKGRTGFFRPSPGLKSAHLNGLDILWTGTQTVLPPSLHPNTGANYVWLTPDTLENFSVSDLPIVDLSFVSKYVKLFESKYPHLCQKNETGQSVGRNNWLKDVVWAKRIAKESEESIVEAVYSMDLCRNNPRLFTDAKEGFSASNEEDAQRNAWKFVARVTKSFIDKKAGPLTTPQILSINLTGKIESFAQTPYPYPTGMLGKLFKLNLDFATRNQPSLAMGGAIALASVIVSNRFKFLDTWSNLYVLNVAETGAGKSFPQKMAKKILTNEIHKEKLLGQGNYRSSSALLQDLPTQRNRLDLIDEASALFGAISNGGIFQNDMDDILCGLFSDSNDLYLGPHASEKKAIRVWHPCVSMLLSTTPSGLKQSISNALATKGFFPRCLLFIDYEYGKQQESFFDESAYKEICTFFKEIRAITNPIPSKNSDLVNDVPNPLEIECTSDALAYLIQKRFQWNEDITDKGISELDRVFLTRAGEYATKLALIHGALRLKKVEMEDVLWACGIMDAMKKNASHLMPQIGAENKNQANSARVYAIISEKGVLTHKELIKRTRWLSKRERNDVLDSLSEEGVIVKAQDERGALWSILK